MSKKNMDEKNRFRSRTIAFRLSPEEADELDMMWKISGYRIKQDYIRDCLFKSKVEAKGNPQMLTSMRNTLKRIEILLTESDCSEEAMDEMVTKLNRIIRILEAF